MFFYFFLILFLVPSPTLLAKAVDNPYLTAKRQGLVIYQENPYTFYCHAPFDARGKLQLTDGSYMTDNSKRIQWEHIVPVRRFAQTMTCWQHPLCTDKKGHAFKGRRCCRAIDTRFQKMEADLHNLVPALPKINQARSYFEFQESVTGVQPIPTCALQVDKKHRLAAPPPALRGFIARTYLYMHQTYHLDLTDAELQQYHAWHQANPPDAWEQKRNQLIFEKQQTNNPFIKP